MKSPFKRKKTKRQCPININSLYRHWERGDNRIDWPRIEKLYDAWVKGEKVPWRKLSGTFIKKLKRQDRNPAREEFFYHPPRGLRRQRINRAAQERHDVFWQDMNNWFENIGNHNARENVPEIPIDLFYGPGGPVGGR